MRDDTGHITDSNFHLTCQHIVRALIEKYGWTLLSEGDLVDSVLNAIQAKNSPGELEKLAKQQYVVALYKACRQVQDLDRREQGYGELFRILYRVAYNRCPELAEDAAQRALLLVYEQIDRCRNPATFLAFAMNKLRHAFKQEWRARGRELFIEEIFQGDVRGERSMPSPSIEQQELCQVLLEAIGRLSNEREQKVILLRFYGGLSDAESAERLGITPGYVRVLRHRAIARLRRDELLRSYLKNSQES